MILSMSRVGHDEAVSLLFDCKFQYYVARASPLTCR